MTQFLDYLKIPKVSKKESAVLDAQIKLGGRAKKDALKRYIEANLRQAVHIAHGFKNLGIDYEDLVQQGILSGLVSFAKYYNPDKNVPFHVFCRSKIKDAIAIYVTKYGHLSVFDLTRHFTKLLLKIRKAEKNCNSDDLAEIAKIAGLDYDTVQGVLSVWYANLVFFNEEEINDITPEREFLAKEALNIVADVVAACPQQEILCKLWGLRPIDGSPHTISEVAKMFDCTPAYVAKVRNQLRRTIKERVDESS